VVSGEDSVVEVVSTSLEDSELEAAEEVVSISEVVSLALLVSAGAELVVEAL
jgi:hypothetical protein